MLNKTFKLSYTSKVILQDNSSVTVAYIDFSKAFDTVSHEKLFTLNS